MPIYDINGCEECGGIRVAGSKLCAGCLVRERDFQAKELLIKGTLIEMCRKKLEIQTGRLDDAVAYGFKRNQENTRLLRHIKGLEGKIREVMEDGKDRMGENTK